jgi:hypothetical protein
VYAGHFLLAEQDPKTNANTKQIVKTTDAFFMIILINNLYFVNSKYRKK